MHLEKLQDLRENARLHMEKHRHLPITSSNPSIIDAIVDSSSLFQVKHMHPMEAIHTPTSSQLPTNIPSTSIDTHEEDIKIFQDANYVEGEIKGFNYLQLFNEEAPHVQVEIKQLDVQHTNKSPIHCTPNLNHQVNEFLQSIGPRFNTWCPTFLPRLSSG